MPDHRDPLHRRRRRDPLQTRFWPRGRRSGVLRVHYAPDLRPQAAPGTGDRGLPEAPGQAHPSQRPDAALWAVSLRAAGLVPGSIWLGEHGLEDFFGALQALLGEHDGLGLVDRVPDHALIVEPVQRIPIKPLPGPPVVVKGQKEERQHRVVDLVRVERHPRTVPDLLELRWGSWPPFNYPHLGSGIASFAPRAMSVSRERPRQMTVFPGGGSRVRAR